MICGAITRCIEGRLAEMEPKQGGENQLTARKTAIGERGQKPDE